MTTAAKRLNVVSVRLTDAELDALDELATLDGVCVGAVMRKGLMALRTRQARKSKALTKPDQPASSI